VSQTMMLPFTWLLLGELSTPLLTVRWSIQSGAYATKSDWVIKVAKALGYKGDAVATHKNAGKQLEFFNGVCLMITFFSVRIVAYSIGYSHMLYVRYTGLIDAVPRSVAWPLNALVGCGAGLNAYWFSIMIRKAMQGPPPREMPPLRTRERKNRASQVNTSSPLNSSRVESSTNYIPTRAKGPTERTRADHDQDRDILSHSRESACA
jgi:hypothetical protein